MKFLYFLKEKIFNQTVLYIWFMIIMILPCFVLAMTEPLSIWVRTASVFIPAAFFGLAFNLFRKPGYFIIISVILLLINGYQLVLIYLFSESVVSPDMFLNIVTSSSGESGELMRTIWPAVTIACVLYFSALLMGIFSIINKQKLSYYFIKRSCITAGVFAVIGVLCLLVNKSKNYPFEADHNIYPYNALYNLNFAVKKYYRILNYPKTSDGFTYNAVKTKESSKREVIVLVIGETSRAHNWQLYGYQRNTTPKLSQRDDIIVYKDVLTQANTTHKIVPIILSPASAENFDMIYKSKSLITAYKEAGYKTAFVSNQIPDKALIDAFASEADTLIQLKNIDSDNIHPYDNDGIPHIEDLINQDNEPLLIVFHTYGSHFDYYHRYPEQKAVFTPHKFTRPMKYDRRDVFRNAYDNTIHNIDNMLNELIDVLDNPEICSSMIYLSDHGEDLMDDNRRMFLHCSPVPTYYQLHIPFIVWMSDNFKNDFPEKFEAISINRDKPISSDVVFHTLLDTGNISTEFFNKELSLTNPDIDIAERFYTDEHDEPINFYHIGLKENDWRMIKKMDLNL